MHTHCMVSGNHRFTKCTFGELAPLLLKPSQVFANSNYNHHEHWIVAFFKIHKDLSEMHGNSKHKGINVYEGPHIRGRHKEFCIEGKVSTKCLTALAMKEFGIVDDSPKEYYLEEIKYRVKRATAWPLTTDLLGVTAEANNRNTHYDLSGKFQQASKLETNTDDGLAPMADTVVRAQRAAAKAQQKTQPNVVKLGSRRVKNKTSVSKLRKIQIPKEDDAAGSFAYFLRSEKVEHMLNNGAGTLVILAAPGLPCCLPAYRISAMLTTKVRDVIHTCATAMKSKVPPTPPPLYLFLFLNLFIFGAHCHNF